MNEALFHKSPMLNCSLTWGWSYKKKKKEADMSFQVESKALEKSCYQTMGLQSNSRDTDSAETPRSAGSSFMALASWPTESKSTAPTSIFDYSSISSLLTLLMPHSVPSKRGTRSRVQLDLSPGCTWHERALHISWCDERNKEVKR